MAVSQLLTCLLCSGRITGVPAGTDSAAASQAWVACVDTGQVADTMLELAPYWTTCIRYLVSKMSSLPKGGKPLRSSLEMRHHCPGRPALRHPTLL